MSRIQILTIGVDKVTLKAAEALCLRWMEDSRPRLVVTPNAEIGYAAYKNPDLAAVLNQADLAIPDGAGIVLASKVLGDPVPGKVAGVDLATCLLAALSQRGGRIYLLGARPEVVSEAARRVAKQYPGLTIAGFRDGYFGQEEESKVVAEIRAANVDALFVGLGAPRQEFWLSQHLADLNAKVSLGIGGTLDIWAGAAPRAPKWMVKANLEWLFRIVKLGRYSRSLPPLIKFVLLVIAQRLKGRQ
ncbi:MAG TPA: WecB/TagA/CpsF family glycosyltransferase [Symbiobacteriaceae bacterium]|jgi:N-acetylglucosaminyldiphosphoundecaprenol N-acetyl-beta-D-mannosaminyltransferase